MSCYSINIDLEGFSKLDIAETSAISDSTVIILLSSSSSNKLFDYYSSVKDLILNRNRIILLIDEHNSNIDKQIAMLMVSYGKYDIYRISDINDIDTDYMETII